MKMIFTLFIWVFLIFCTANAFAADPDLTGCWDVYIDQISSWGTPEIGLPGEASTEHNTIWIEQGSNDNRFSGFVSNLPSGELGRNFSGVVVGKDVYITHWDSVTKATLIGKDQISGVNQAFGDSVDRDSRTASATAFRLDTDTCCDGVQNGDEIGIDCGGPTCGSCPDPE